MINVFGSYVGKEELYNAKQSLERQWMGAGNFVKQFETAFAEAYTQKVVFGVPYDTEGGVQIGAETYQKGNPATLKEAQEIFMKEAETIVNEMISQDVKDAFARGEVKQIVALIAYMNSLGQSRRTATQVSQAAQ